MAEAKSWWRRLQAGLFGPLPGGHSKWGGVWTRSCAEISCSFFQSKLQQRRQDEMETEIEKKVTVPAIASGPTCKTFTLLTTQLISIPGGQPWSDWRGENTLLHCPLQLSLQVVFLFCSLQLSSGSQLCNVWIVVNLTWVVVCATLKTWVVVSLEHV